MGERGRGRGCEAVAHRPAVPRRGPGGWARPSLD